MIDTGLWRYTRHPNYFGDSTLWYGIYLIACGGSTGPAGGYWTFYSPLMMNFSLIYITGALINEANQKRKPAYRVYMLETNRFVPWFYKKIEGEQREQLIEKFKIEIEEDRIKNKGSILFGIFKREWKKTLYKGGPPDEEDEVGNGNAVGTNQVLDVNKTTENKGAKDLSTVFYQDDAKQGDKA